MTPQYGPELTRSLAAFQAAAARDRQRWLTAKEASLGGDGRDTDFESSFASLAQAYLRDKAPSLLDFLVGFELLDRNEDNTKAVGIFGFQVGPQWLYAPMFFLNGSLKGHELLYVKNIDKFLPLKENWLNHLLRRRPNVLGEAVPNNLPQLGVLPPDLRTFTLPPGKFGAARAKREGMLAGKAAFAHFALTNPYRDPKYADIIDLPTFLQKEGRAVIVSLIKGLQAFPKAAEALDKIHGLKIIKEALAHVRAQEKAARDVLATKSANPYLPGGAPEQLPTAPQPVPEPAPQPPGIGGGAFGLGVGGAATQAQLPPLPEQPTPNFPPGMAGGDVTGFPSAPPEGGFGGPAQSDLLPPGGMGDVTGQQPPQDPGYWQQFNDWLGQNASWIPEWLPGGRGANLLAGLGLAGGAGYMLSRRRRGRDELIDELEGKTASHLDEPGPFAKLMESGRHGPSGEGPGGSPRPRPGVLSTTTHREEQLAGKRRRKFAADMYKRAGKVAFVTMDTVEGRGIFAEATEEERDGVAQTGMYVKDERPESARAYAVETKLQLANPSRTGVYEVLCRPGSFERCLVLFFPVSARGKEAFATVVRLSDKAWLNIHPGHLWCKPPGNEQADFNDELDKLDGPGELKTSYSALHVLICPDGSATVPFCAHDKLDGDSSVTTYEVHLRDHARTDRPGYLPRLADRRGQLPDANYGCGCDDLLHLTSRKGGTIKALGGQVYVPDGCKLLTLREDSDSEEYDSYHADRSDPPPLLPGNLVDVQRVIYEKSAALEVRSDLGFVWVNGQEFEPEAAVVHLVHGWDLREKQARAIVADAAPRVTTYRVAPAGWMVDALRGVYDSFYKSAAPGDPMNPAMFNGSVAPPMPPPPMGLEPTLQGAVQSQYPQLQEMQVQMADPSIGSNRDVYDPRFPDPRTMAVGFQAASLGQKQVFDDAMIGSLLRTTGDDTMVDRHMGTLMKSVDRLGRILFSLYWHGEEFEDRYGKTDMPELEDGLRNAFESLGDVVLFLKQRSIEPFPDEAAGADLGSVSQD